MMRKLVCLDGATLYPAASAEWQKFELPGIETVIYDRTAPGELIERLRGAEMVLTNKVVIGADTILAIPTLRYIGVLATGFNIVDTKAASDAGIVATNIPAYSTASVAQHAIALLLAITNRVESYSQSVRNGKWNACPDFTYRIEEWSELEGKLFGVVGFGNTGQATAAIAAALGMRVGVFTSKESSMLPTGYVKMDLDSLFAEADVLSLHCPLTAATENLVDRRRLSMMKRSAILINTSRGPVVDEEALADALKTGRIYAAGLDVLTSEPPRSGNPLIGVSNCFITPHVAWSSVEARERLASIAVKNIKAYLEGCPINVVN